MKGKTFLAAAVFGIVLFLTLNSCTIRHELSVRADRSGNAEIDIVLHPVFDRFVTDLAGGGWDEKEDPPIFDLTALQYAFDQYEELDLQSSSIPRREELELKVAFDNINTVFSVPSRDVPGMFTYSRTGGVHKLRIAVNRKNIMQVLKLNPLGGTGLELYLLPPEGETMDEEEYIDYLIFSFEPYAPEEELRKIFKNSQIVLSVIPEGEIVSQRGGRISGNRVVFSMPVLTLFTISETRIFEIKYR
jgi:hypothetical protein